MLDGIDTFHIGTLHANIRDVDHHHDHQHQHRQKKHPTSGDFVELRSFVANGG